LEAISELHNVEVAGIINISQHLHEIDRYDDRIESLAQEAGFPCLNAKGINTSKAEKFVRDLKPDLALAVGCRVIIPRTIYAAPRFGTIALHDSLLPEYKGFAPLNWSIINGEKHTGVTLFFLNEIMDGGDIVASKEVKIEADETAPQVYEKVCKATIDLLVEQVPLVASGKCKRYPQDCEEGSFTCSRSPEDGLIQWDQPTERIYNLIRALAYPYPGAFTYYNQERLIIWQAEVRTAPPCYKGRIHGKIIGYSKKEGWSDLLTGDGILRVTQVQLGSGEKQNASNILNKVRRKVGLTFEDLLNKINTLETELEKIRSK